MNTYKLYSLVKLSFFTGIIILSVSIAFFLPKVQEKVNPPFVSNTESLGTDFKSVTTTLGISLTLSPNELANFSCNKNRLPTLEKKDFFWQTVCENKVGTPYIGIYWKRPDYQKITFQNGVLNEFLKNKSAREQTSYNGKFSCVENKKRKDMTKMSSAIVDCVTTITNSKVKLYTTFIYSYPIESISLNANSVIIISSLSEKETSETVSYIFSKLHKISTASNKNIYSDSFIEKAYASAGGAAGSGGTGAGVGDCGTGSAGTGTGSCGPGDSGAAASGDSGTSGGDPASGPVGDGVSTSPSVCINGATDWPTCTPQLPGSPTNVTATCTNTEGTLVNISWTAGTNATEYYPRVQIPLGRSCPVGWTLWTDGTTCYQNGITSTSVTFTTTPNQSYNSWVHSGISGMPDWTHSGDVNFICSTPSPSVNIKFN